MIKGFKVTDKDLQCRGFQYELNKEFTTDQQLKMCSVGFHYCEKINDCWSYYNFDSNNRVFEIDDYGDTIKGDNKNCTNKIKFIRELTWAEVLLVCNEGKNNTGDCNTGDCNTGNRNTGNRNTGNRNTGDWNTGDCNTGNSNTGNSNTGNSNTGNRNTGNRNTGNSNTGNRNTGNRNTGDWNSVNYETGFFNSKQSEFVNVFNKPCKKEVWDNCRKPNFIYFDITKWDGEKTISINYKQAFQESYKKATKEDIELLKQLPNFDSEVFFEISGIKI